MLANPHDNMIINAYNILLNLDYDEIMATCDKNRQFVNICNSYDFWRDKAVRDFDIEPDEFYEDYDPIIPPNQRYLQLEDIYG